MTPTWMDHVPAKFTGPAGRVWQFAPPPADSDDPRIAVTIGNAYLIFAPGAHPLWSWHVMFGVALRDEPGVDPAHRQYPEAEYELMVWALDPERDPPDPRRFIFAEDREPGMLLQPPDAVVQFHGTGDEGASKLLALCARACADGVLVPDSDHRGAWERTVRATAEHERGGHGLETGRWGQGLRIDDH